MSVGVLEVRQSAEIEVGTHCVELVLFRVLFCAILPAPVTRCVAQKGRRRLKALTVTDDGMPGPPC